MFAGILHRKEVLVLLHSSSNFGRNHGNLSNPRLSSLSHFMNRPVPHRTTMRVEGAKEATEPEFAFNTAGGDIPYWLDLSGY